MKIIDINTLPDDIKNIYNKRNFALDTNIIFSSDLFPRAFYFLKGVNLPGINCSPVETYYPGKKYNTSVIFDNDTIVYNPLSVSFNIDENFIIYREIYNAFINQSTNINNEKNSYIIIKNNKGKTVLCIKYIDCTIMDISDIQYLAENNDNPLLLDCTINYTEMEIIESVSEKIDIGGIFK